MPKKKFDEHFSLIQKGLILHEKFKYSDALLYFENAYKLAPRCPSAMYNYANTLHMLERDIEAYNLLQQIVNSSIEDLRLGCQESREPPKSYQVDAYYLLFHVVFYWKRSWEEAFPYAQKHLVWRTRGLKSAWTIKQIRKELRDLKAVSTSRSFLRISLSSRK